MEAADEDIETFKLEIENELRIVTDQISDVTLEMQSGSAEIFGTELQQKKIYTFPPSTSVAVYTYHGCTLVLKGKPEITRLSTETSMIVPVNLHASLEELRIAAEKNESKGPISLVVGPTDVGKSTLCRLLLNYAVRCGRKPLFIDLDVGQNSVSIPGTIAVLPVGKTADVCEGFDQQGISVYHFGYKSPGHDIPLYFLLLKRLGQKLSSRLQQVNKYVRASGAIIDTCGWVRGQGYEMITIAALAFEIDVLFVVEEQKLYLQLRRDMPSCVKVVYVPKMDGVMERNRALRWLTRDKRIEEYFYGSRTPLFPHSFEVKFSDIKIYQVKVSSFDAPGSSHDRDSSVIKFEPVPITQNLLNMVLGVSCADNIEEDLNAINVIGFICMKNVDIKKEVVTVLSPQPSPLPNNILLLSDITFVDRN